MSKNKQDLIEIVSTETNISKLDAENAINALIRAITNELKSGGEVVLVNFGSFKAVRRAARKGRNPQTGNEINIPAANAVKFKVGKGLKDLINQYLEDHKHLKLEKLDMRIITHGGVERYYAIVVFHPATKPYKTREVSK